MSKASDLIAEALRPTNTTCYRDNYSLRLSHQDNWHMYPSKGHSRSAAAAEQFLNFDYFPCDSTPDANRLFAGTCCTIYDKHPSQTMSNVRDCLDKLVTHAVIHPSIDWDVLKWSCTTYTDPNAYCGNLLKTQWPCAELFCQEVRIGYYFNIQNYFKLEIIEEALGFVLGEPLLTPLQMYRDAISAVYRYGYNLYKFEPGVSASSIQFQLYQMMLAYQQLRGDLRDIADLSYTAYEDCKRLFPNIILT